MEIKTIEIKYIAHSETGLPIKIPPYLKQELRHNTSAGKIQAEMIRNSRTIGQRSINDCLPFNMAENIRFRKVARAFSRELALFAENLGVDRYCTIVHGSVARGLVRYPDNPDPSDLDIDLIIDYQDLDKETRKNTRESFLAANPYCGIRVDSYIKTLNEIKENKGDYARIYLGSSAYPLINKGQAWEEVKDIGLTYQQYLLLNKRAKKIIKGVQPDQTRIPSLELINKARLSCIV